MAVTKCDPRYHASAPPSRRAARTIRKKAAAVMVTAVDFAPPPIALSPGVEDMRRTASSDILRRSSKPGGMRKAASSTQLPPMPMGRSAASSQPNLGTQTFAIGSPSSSSPSPAKKLPMPPRPLKKMYTGVGIVPSFGRASVFEGASQVKLSLSAGPTRLTDDVLRAQRAARQKAERAERPAKKRGAHVHLPLTTELQPWVTSVPPKTALAADKFDRSHRQRWDTGENLYFSLSRDLTHQAKQDAFSVATMELAMNRFHVPVDLSGVQRFEMRQKKSKPKKPWKLEESIWGEPTKPPRINRSPFSTHKIRLSCLYLPPTAFVVSCPSLSAVRSAACKMVRFQRLLGFGRVREEAV